MAYVAVQLAVTEAAEGDAVNDGLPHLLALPEGRERPLEDMVAHPVTYASIVRALAPPLSIQPRGLRT